MRERERRKPYLVGAEFDGGFGHDFENVEAVTWSRWHR